MQIKSFHICICINIKWILWENGIWYFGKNIGLILPKFENKETNVHQECQKRQIMSALISGFIGLAFKGISSFLQHKWRESFTTGYAYNE